MNTILFALHDMFRCLGGIGLTAISAIAIGETMFAIEAEVLEVLRKRRERQGKGNSP